MTLRITCVPRLSPPCHSACPQPGCSITEATVATAGRTVTDQGQTPAREDVGLIRERGLCKLTGVDFVSRVPQVKGAGRALVLTAVILATGEAKIWKMVVRGQPEK
jgi:hypothetical protein